MRTARKVFTALVMELMKEEKTPIAIKITTTAKSLRQIQRTAQKEPGFAVEIRKLV